MGWVPQTIDSVVNGITELGLIKFSLIVVVALLVVVVSFITWYMLKELTKLKKDVDACHAERRAFKIYLIKFVARMTLLSLDVDYQRLCVKLSALKN